MANEPAFDWSQAESLLGDNPNEVDPDMAGIVLELISSSEERFQYLKKMDPADSKAISSLAHQLRGSLLNFGYTEVGGILHKIEYKEFEPGALPGLIDQAVETFRASNKLLAAKYPVIGIA
jgi:HPt (histidine-containing phosphotransfer) domain-containing protein